MLLRASLMRNDSLEVFFFSWASSITGRMQFLLVTQMTILLFARPALFESLWWTLWAAFFDHFIWEAVSSITSKSIDSGFTLDFYINLVVAVHPITAARGHCISLSFSRKQLKSSGMMFCHQSSLIGRSDRSKRDALTDVTFQIKITKKKVKCRPDTTICFIFELTFFYFFFIFLLLSRSKSKESLLWKQNKQMYSNSF